MNTKNKKNAAMFVKVDLKTRQRLKVWCARKEISMSDVIAALIEKCLRGEIQIDGLGCNI